MSRVQQALLSTSLHQDSIVSLELRDCLPAVLKRKRLFLAIFFGIFLSCSLYVLSLPKSYMAHMKLLVRNERQDLIISADRNTSALQSVEPSESEVNSEIELLRSSDVLRKVALMSGLSRPEPGTVQAAGQVSPVSLDRALDDLGRDLSVSPVRKSSVIELAYTSVNPQLASTVLKNLSDVYLQAHLAVHGTPGSYAFFEQQANAYRDRLIESEQDLKAFQEEYSSVLLPDQDRAFSTQFMNSKAALEETEAQVADYSNRMSRDTQLLATLEPRVVTQMRTVPQAQLVGNLNQTLAELRNKRTELRTKFRADDRMVLEVEKQIADTTAALDDALKQVSTEKQTDVNPLRENAEKELLATKVALAGLEARRASLAEVVSGYNDKLHTLAGAKIEHDQRLRRVKENEDNYLLYEKKREEARIAESLDRERITNVAIIEAPATPVQPSGPRIKRDILLSGLCAALLAFTSVLGLEVSALKSGVHLPVGSANVLLQPVETPEI
jgi:uncharacterized protein involved in exopolysaccharide biosynthesis